MGDVAEIREIQAAITERGQTTIPAAIRKLLALGKRDRIVFRGLADGTVLIAKRSTDVDADPVMDRFLEFLALDMTDHPERMHPMPVRLVERATRLVEGVHVDLDQALPADDA